MTKALFPARLIGATVAAAAILLAACITMTEAAVEAGTLTTVDVYAPLYDPNTSEDNGCDPSGCVGEYTRVRLTPFSPLNAEWIFSLCCSI